MSGSGTGTGVQVNGGLIRSSAELRELAHTNPIWSRPEGGERR
jgi:hypothetical protein